MSSDAGATTRDTTRTVIALLAVVGFVLVAAILPIAGAAAPGHSLVPQSLGGEGSGGSQSAVERALEGEPNSGPDTSTSGSQSMVQGLLNKLNEGSPSPGASGSGTRSGGQGQGGESAFGALNTGQQTGVGSSEGLTSQSLRSQSSTPHLIVRSSEPGYWRTGAFNTYTGSGWDATDLPLQPQWPRQPGTAPGARETVTQEYRLLQSATALPSVWEPTDLTTTFGTPVKITQQGALQTTEPVPANTTYTVTSRTPPRDPDRLRGAGRDYPARVESTYTQFPDSTPDRVADRTDRITEGAETPYAKAVAIEQWLESNRRYSLNASHDGGDVTDQFLFEMEKGYCEYFATSMAVMLRTQDIPARYAVGYSTGQPQGNGTYLVRAMNAHAWVEVYFPDTGWVRFDPTPGRSRLANEFRAYQRAAENGNATAAAEKFLDSVDDGSLGGGGASGSPGEGTGSSGGTGGANGGSDGSSDEGTNDTVLPDSYNHTESGSPGESFGPEGTSYSISLQGEPVPGQPISVLVELGSSPAADVAVTFNGRRIGRTNATGQVTGEVPFARNLVVNVRGNATTSTAGSAALLGAGGAALSTGESGLGTSALQQSGNETNTTRTFTVPTDIEIRLLGDPTPGETTTVVTTIRNRSVSGATLSLNGSTVGQTDANGRIDVEFPGRERVVLTATRGEATGNRTIQVANVSVNTTGFALPGLSITVTVTDQGDPVEGATVTVGGETATTGSNGQATVTLPMATSATLSVETAAGITEQQPVEFRFLTAGAVLVVVVVGLVVLVVLWRKAAARGISIREQVAATLYWLSGAFVSVLVGLAIRGERVLSQFPVVARRVADAIREAWAALVAAIRGQEVDLRALPSPRALLAWLLSVLRGLGASAKSTVTPTTAAEEGTPAATGDAAVSDPDARAQVRQAWRSFRGRLPVTNYQTKTPGELARIGIEEGFPDDAVWTLRDAVQAIEYGRRDPATFLDAVSDAEREIGATGPVADETSANGDGDDGDPDSTAGGTEEQRPARDAPHAADGGAEP